MTEHEIVSLMAATIYARADGPSAHAAVRAAIALRGEAQAQLQLKYRAEQAAEQVQMTPLERRTERRHNQRATDTIANYASLERATPLGPHPARCTCSACSIGLDPRD